MSTTRQFPSRPSLEHLRNEAKVLWKAFTAHDTDALERFTRHPRTRDSTKGEMKLADAQHVHERPARIANRLEDPPEASLAVVLDDEAGAG